MPSDPKDRLIVALDVDSIDRAVALVDALAGQVTRFKIGSQLFTAVGPPAVEAVRKRGGEVFLDLKFHDIPNTVEGAAREAVRLGVFMFNVHASGGRAMMRAAAHGAAESAHALGVPRPLVIAVTVLTSLDRVALGARAPRRLVRGRTRASPLRPRPRGRARRQRRLAQRDPRHSQRPWTALGHRHPGCPSGRRRAPGPVAGGHPRAATEAGADYLVVGRPITAAADPAAAAAAVLAEMRG